ncbi:uncharacterized protein TRAVEDRAFT_145096 [Trametes versicolor FP-101664 SS1]|uniref:uncharacterized protein n=1 Tax=Trametes versicolor (strain FP-101664) TaxID=717944 RepID=UPI00046238E4|nr:uncharacterized protein TRAVEDRAFT_145096 [Trametes versicolor FP-101664 SS1]EIW60054.1 hypothetical protein TRAVEDRAFT_145096 [Trametes versicolor FP-101664 SS1]
MELGRAFFKVRAAVFGVMMLVSLLWTILLSVEVFVLYDQSDTAQRNFVGVLIFINALTAILLPALLLVQFRPWLDAARLLFLLLAQFGTAALFTSWNPTFQCPTENTKRCQSVNLAILICSWVIPAMLTWYSAFLAVMYYWRKDHPPTDSPEKRLSDLPMMIPSRRPSLRRPSVAPVAPVTPMRPAVNRASNTASQTSRPSWLAASPSTPVASSSRAPPQRGVPANPVYESTESSYSSPRSSGRLSKPPPPLMY